MSSMPSIIKSNNRYQFFPTKEGDNLLFIENYDQDQDFSLKVGNIHGFFGTLYFKKLESGLFELAALSQESL